MSSLGTTNHGGSTVVPIASISAAAQKQAEQNAAPSHVDGELVALYVIGSIFILAASVGGGLLFYKG